MTTAASGIIAVIIRQNGMLFSGGDKRANAEGGGASIIFCMVLGIGLGFGAALAFPVLTIPIPDMRPSERIIAINFSGIYKLVCAPVVRTFARSLRRNALIGDSP